MSFCFDSRSSHRVTEFNLDFVHFLSGMFPGNNLVSAPLELLMGSFVQSDHSMFVKLLNENVCCWDWTEDSKGQDDDGICSMSLLEYIFYKQDIGVFQFPPVRISKPVHPN